jgi:4-hydroxy-tetrahydrodipicolinate synthase
MEFKGSYVAMVTPFDDKNRLDQDKLREQVEFQIKSGTDGLVPCGTTGESPTLSWDEHKLAVKTVVEAAKGRVPVIAGAGSNNTAEALEAALFAKKVGADAVLIVNPYYNKPTQEGLYRHFRMIAEKCGLPVVVYNIQSRTGVNVETATMVRLMEVPNIRAVKEASENMKQISDVIRLCGHRLDVLSGDDALTLPLLAVGGKGIISVAANIIPREVKELCTRFFAGDMKAAIALHQRMLPLVQALFTETNPIPVKEAMNLMGMKVGELRLPLTPLSEKGKEKLVAEMKKFGLKV